MSLNGGCYFSHKESCVSPPTSSVWTSCVIDCVRDATACEIRRPFSQRKPILSVKGLPWTPTNRGGLSSIQYVQHEGTVTARILDPVARWEDGIRVRWSLGASSRAARRSLRPPRHWPLFLWLNSGIGEIVCPFSRGIAAVRKPRGYAISSSSFFDSSSCWNIFLFFFVGLRWYKLNHSQALLLIYFVVNR